VIVLGGSAAFDLWKQDGDTWPDQLERQLRESLPCRIEVLNAGTPGYSTWQAARLLEKRLLSWHPDLVLVYELYNDSITFRHGDRQEIIEGWKLNGRANAIGWAAHPNILLDGLGKIFPRTVDFLRLRLVQFSGNRRLRENAQFWWDPSLSGRVQPAGLAFYQENLTHMARLLRERGNVPMGIVTQATLIRETNTDEERQRIHYLYRGLDHARLWAGYQAAWEINRKTARSEPNVFLIEAQKSVPASLDFFYDEVHLNGEGSRRLARVTAEGLVERFGPDRATAVGTPEGHDLPRLHCPDRD
jgi:lysophospholipase L1-like esterase